MKQDSHPISYQDLQKDLGNQYPPVDTDGYRYCALAERKTANKKWTYPRNLLTVAAPAILCYNQTS